MSLSQSPAAIRSRDRRAKLKAEGVKYWKPTSTESIAKRKANLRKNKTPEQIAKMEQISSVRRQLKADREAGIGPSIYEYKLLKNKENYVKRNGSKKLPEGEAKRRHEERNRIANEKRKAERKAYRIANGIPEPRTPEEKKEAMRLYMQKQRAAYNAERAKVKAAKAKAEADRKALKAEKRKPVPVAKVIVPKVAKVVIEKRLPQSPKVTLIKKERKPKQQSDRMVIPTTPPMTEYTYIPELKMSVHLEKGQTIAQVIAKYNQRPGNKIGKW